MAIRCGLIATSMLRVSGASFPNSSLDLQVLFFPAIPPPDGENGFPNPLHDSGGPASKGSFEHECS
jgi:hypothetical protein